MRKELIISGVIILLVIVSLFVIFSAETDTPNDAASNANAIPYTEIVNPSGFLNTPEDAPITIGQFVGENVILVDFMTYSCINCQRTFPYVTAWYETYKDDGLMVIGIHTPEFAFEKNIDNVRAAMERFGITYPVVLDNDYATWSAYGNRYWPRKYLIDIHGNVVYDHIGEGAYEETEEKIRELLAERAALRGASVDYDELLSATIDGDKSHAQSPEVYFGAGRNEFLGNGAAGKTGMQTFSLPAAPRRDTLYLGGTWNIADEYAASVSDAVVVFPYTARTVYMVAEANEPVAIEVWQDGARVGENAGGDVTNGVVQVEKSGLYRLIDNDATGSHVLELRVKGDGARLYTFTFG